MLGSLQRWFGRRAGAAVSGVDAWPELADWAAQRGLTLRPARGVAGFAIDGGTATQPWRLEWGPSQRSYVEGAELRLRAEVRVPGDLQAMVVDRELQARMERAIFDQFVESVQTRIDNQTPPEMRWLVMCQKLGGAELGPLRDRFGAVCNARAWMQRWIDGPLATALARAPLAEGQPMVLMVARGRLTLRTALGNPEPALLKDWVSIFQTAAAETRRVSPPAAAAAPSTQPSLWSPSQMAADEPPR
ncbi:MAG: hypothetical protein MUF03_07095 [Rubrivivax sp.]|jgi:hypothetical protein|nr:hypothetical protein [Rubrivivax sp.]